MCFFFSWQLWWPMKWPRADFPPLVEFHEEVQLWCQQQPSTSSESSDKSGEVSPGFRNLPYWLRFWVLFGSGTGYLPPPSWKHTGRAAQMKYPGHTLSWSWHWVGLGWKIRRNPHPVKRYWMGAVWKTPGNTHIIKSYWDAGVGGALSWKKWRNTQGSAERCQGHFGVQCRGLSGFSWVVTEEADLTLLSSTAFMEFVRVKL